LWSLLVERFRNKHRQNSLLKQKYMSGKNGGIVVVFDSLF